MVFSLAKQYLVGILERKLLDATAGIKETNDAVSWKRH